MPAMAIKSDLLERLRGAWRNRTHQIDVTSRVRTACIKLDGYTSNHNWHTALVEQTLKPGHQRCCAGRSFVQRENFFDIHRNNFKVVFFQVKVEKTLIFSLLSGMIIV